jgi:hypothetical protein
VFSGKERNLWPNREPVLPSYLPTPVCQPETEPQASNLGVTVILVLILFPDCKTNYTACSAHHERFSEQTGVVFVLSEHQIFKVVSIFFFQK